MDNQHLRFSTTRILRSIREDGAQLVWIEGDRIQHTLSISRLAERVCARRPGDVVGVFNTKAGRQDLEEQILFCARDVENVG